MCEKLEEQGYLGDPLLHSEQDAKVFLMIVYHDELQVAVSKGLLDIKKFYPQEGDDKIHQAVIDEIMEETKNPLLDEQEIASLLKSIKKLPLPHEVRAEQYVHDNNLTCDVGHKDDYFYITEENIAIEAFRAGIKQATDQFKLRVDLGIAWNTGANWLIFGLGL